MPKSVTFVALKTFWSPELRSTYVEGLYYTLVGDIETEATRLAGGGRGRDIVLGRLKTLRALVPKWIEQRLIAFVEKRGNHPEVQISGEGAVT